MQSVIRSIFVLFLLGFFTAASAQLPPKVIADKYLIQAEQLIEKKDYIAALDMMDKIIALQKEHSFTLPEEFHFKYAQVAFSVGSLQIAFESVGKYLSAETEGKFYKEALALLLKIEEELKELEISPEKTCAGKPVDSSCWMALTNHPECYVWNPNLKKDETVTWSGEYSGAFAQGEGTLIHNYNYTNANWRPKIEATGHLRNGKRHGQWVERFSDIHSSFRSEEEGPYVNGKRHGEWVYRDSSGVVFEEGPYVDGKRHGEWIYRYSDGSVKFKGPYVDGKYHGQWVWRARDGRVGGGSFVDGKKQGQWVEIYGREVEEGPYVNGKRHGEWVYRWSDGSVKDKGPYVNGKRHGQWVINEGGGSIYIVTYVNGKKQSRRFRGR